MWYLFCDADYISFSFPSSNLGCLKNTKCGRFYWVKFEPCRNSRHSWHCFFVPKLGRYWSIFFFTQHFFEYPEAACAFRQIFSWSSASSIHSKTKKYLFSVLLFSCGVFVISLHVSSLSGRRFCIYESKYRTPIKLDKAQNAWFLSDAPSYNMHHYISVRANATDAWSESFE